MVVFCVYATTANAGDARRLGRVLVEARLAACANVIDGVQSIYWWEGQVQETSEAALILKTTEDRVEALIAKLQALHSYDCPGIEAWPIERGNPAFIAWVEQETRG